jgi:gluconokinase
MAKRAPRRDSVRFNDAGRGRAVQADQNSDRGLVVMGVSGSGKSTLAAELARALACPLIEGDSFHSPANVAKMAAGHALDDADRWPWLDRVGAAISTAAEGGIAVAACSALRRVYRERLQAASDVPLAFVLLDTGAVELARRLEARAGHYMPASLLDSQLATLERPGADECALTLDAKRTPGVLRDAVLAWLQC